MPGRYSNLLFINNGKEIESFPPILAKNLQRNDDIIVTIKSGIRIDQLAQQYLGDGKLFWTILFINGAKTPFDDIFLPGKIIRIPRNVQNIFNAITNALNNQ